MVTKFELKVEIRNQMNNTIYIPDLKVVIENKEKLQEHRAENITKYWDLTRQVGEKYGTLKL